MSGSLKEGSTTGKISTTYPPIFYARPGESWEQYWRTVTFWLASEGKSLPVEMRGPRLMQQLRERAGKIVQHLTVEQVTSEQGVELIKLEMEKSPIIRLLDNKKIDKRRPKFMKLTRLANESIESFINRAEIYRRENEASPAYRVGSCFYVGHLLDSCKLTRKDLALLKAACGGDVEDETKVISAMLELAEQFEGAPHCPIGRGEPQLDNEDQYLVQKPGASTSSTPPTSASEHVPRRRPFPRGRGGGNFGRFRRGRIRDALVAILEDEEDGEVGAEELLDFMGEESMDDEEARSDQVADMTEFNGVPNEAFVAATTSESPPSASPLAEIYAQEYKARNRVREIKKMRQYFQKDAPGGPAAARSEHVKKWVAEQQKKEPCFICHQLGHWSQECPYRRKEKPMVHSANVTFPSSQPQHEDWALLETLASAGVYMVHSGGGGPDDAGTHEIFWALDELAGQEHSKMIVDLGCMRTVAGTTWTNRIVKEWKENNWFIKVVPEEEQFRFGDGQVVQSKFAVLLEVALAGIHGILRISVVHGTCPPLLSKPVCSALGLVIDTASHSVSSRRFGVKGYGLGQSRGGHYVIPINDFGEISKRSISSDFVMQDHKEIVVLSDPRGSAIRDWDQDDLTPSDSLPEAHGRAQTAACERAAGSLRAQPAGMGTRGTGQRTGRDVRPRGGSYGLGSGENADEDGEAAVFESHVAEEPDITQSSGAQTHGQDEQGSGHQGDRTDSGCFELDSPDGHDPDEHGSDAGDDDEDARADGTEPEQGTRARDRGRGTSSWPEQRASAGQRQGEEDTQGGQNRRAHWGRSALSIPVDPVLGRSHDEPDDQPAGPDIHLQMEAAVAHATSQTGGGNREAPLEAQSKVDHEDARQPHRQLVGTSGVRPTTMLLSEGGMAGSVDQDGLETAEMKARRQDRIDLVLSEKVEDYEEMVDALQVAPDYKTEDPEGGLSADETVGMEEYAAGVGKHTLNRRQRRTIQQGVQKALLTHAKVFDVLDAKSAQVKAWTLLEIFAGCARFSQRARQRRSACWDVLPPQDILYGLDLLDPQQLDMLKDVIRTQRPDVVTVAPPCGPWSAWQRMRKRKSALRELRRQHLPFWEFVTWLWDFQCSTGGLVVLEQPASFEALRLPMMTRRRQVHQRVVHMCRLGMRDKVTKKPHKKPTVVQMNHAAITTEMFPARLCQCQPGDHQPIEGSVTVWDDEKGKMTAVKRSTLAAQWPEGFCDWLLDGLEALKEENSHVRIELHQPTPDTRIWEAVPVEIEPTAEGQLRQQMAAVDGLHRYDYISFLGASSGLGKKVRSTLAHLHVALGHISNDKLARMMSQNGAKTVVLQAIKDMECQICRQVTAPHTTPKSAYARPMSFNVRVCSDTFYVWDAKATKFAVTHLVDAFSLYQMAIVSVDASAQSTVSLLRDGWIRAFGDFGAPNVLMTDQGPEFQGVVEGILRTFSVYHDMGPS